MKLKNEILPFEVILLATHSDVIAMNHVLKHFESLLNFLKKDYLMIWEILIPMLSQKSNEH